MKLLVLLGALNAFLAVALGAFGAHGLRASLSAQMLEVYRTAADYHLTHALGLILIGLLADRIDGATMHWAGGFMLAGIVLFCGSLYLLSVTEARWLGAITPLGGGAFLLAWALAAIAAWRGL